MARTPRSNTPRHHLRRAHAALIAAAVLLTPTATDSGAWFTDTTTPASATLTAATLPAVEQLSATRSGDSVNLTWQPPKTGARPAAYTVSRSINGAPATQVAAVSGRSNSFLFQEPVYPEGDAGFAQIEASRSGSFTVARDTYGRVWVTGEGGPIFGNGVEDVSVRRVFVPVPGPTPGSPAFNGRKIIDIAAGTSSIIAVDDAGGIWTWGHAATPMRPAVDPRPVRTTGLMFGDMRIEDVDAGENSWVALTQSGQILTWGANEANQLGRDTKKQLSSTPAPVESLDRTFASKVFTSVSSGTLHSVALASDGTIWAWGRNLQGELGNGTLSSGPAAVQMKLPAGVNAAQVEAGESISYIRESNGTLWYVGAPPGFPKTSGFEQADGKYLHVSAGSRHGVAVLQSGQVVTWGLAGSAPQLESSVEPGASRGLGIWWPTRHELRAEAGSGTSFSHVAEDFAPGAYARGANSKGQLGTGQNATETTAKLTCRNNPNCGLSGDVRYTVTYRVGEWTSPDTQATVTIPR